MIRVYVEGKFTIDYYPILGVDITTKHLIVNEVPLKLYIVDSSAKLFFSKIRPSYYRGASALILTFNKGKKASFNAVNDWYQEFKKFTNLKSHSVRLDKLVDTPIALVGLVSDPEEVTTEKGQDLAEELNASFYETHPTDKKKTAQIFHDMALRVISIPDDTP